MENNNSKDTLHSNNEGEVTSHSAHEKNYKDSHVHKGGSRVNSALIFAHIANLASLAIMVLYFLKIFDNFQIIEYFVLGLLALSSFLCIIGEFRKRKLASFFFLINCATITCVIVVLAFFKH